MTPQDIAKELLARRPTKLKVLLNDETTQTVSLPKGRNRYARVAAVIDQLAWAEIHCLDQQSALQGVIRRAEEATSLEPLGTVGDGTVVQATALAQILARAIGDAHKVAVQQTSTLVEKLRTTMASEMKDILSAHKDLAQYAFDRALEAEEALQTKIAEQNELAVEMELQKRKGESGEDFRSRVLASFLDGKMDAKRPPEGPGGHGGANGANGAG